MTNVVKLSEYRRSETRPAEVPNLTAEELAAMAYGAALDRAGADFDRLVAVARARDYRPEWVGHQMEERGRSMTGPQHALMAQMIAEAGPYLGRRHRWILRQVKAKPTCVEALARLAKGTPEFRSYRNLVRCVGNDVTKLVERGLIQEREGVIYENTGGSGGATLMTEPRLEYWQGRFEELIEEARLAPLTDDVRDTLVRFLRSEVEVIAFGPGPPPTVAIAPYEDLEDDDGQPVSLRPRGWQPPVDDDDWPF